MKTLPLSWQMAGKIVALFLVVGAIAAALPVPHPTAKIEGLKVNIPLSEEHLTLFLSR